MLQNREARQELGAVGPLILGHCSSMPCRVSVAVLALPEHAFM